MTTWIDLPWAQSAWWQAIAARTAPSFAAEPSPFTTPGWGLWLSLALGAVIVLLPPTWRLVRIVVTFVHELGHAAVGVVVGRRFTGFVVRGDMSGHAVTVGRTRGPGLVATTWAGYPAPALAGAALVWAALAGWSAPVLFAVALGAVVTLVFVRSWSTAGTTLAVAAAAGALWWWRDDARSSAVLLAVAAVLLLGAWRHWGAVARVPRASDPATLARLTGWPGWFWVATHFVTIAAATAGAGWLVWGAVTAP